MKYVMALIENQALISAAAGWFAAQVIKMIIEVRKEGFSLQRLAGGGGMPSSHSATVTALVVGTGLAEGIDSSIFAIALFFAIIVIYDARGVRYETGQEAKILNALRQRDMEQGTKPVFDTPLDEKMGHTIPEIAVGIAVGIFAALLIEMI